ncbi:MAG: glycoside hydrolase/phage tail family protein [Aestuariivirga sp.]|uniref:baseplate multidomain protein megatron n=1 Tax=Aestuariivirga sp. TaxID=2650926 RepID=UPI0038D0A3A8
MATVVLQAVGAGLGTMLGGPLGGMIGRAIGALAGSFVDQKLFGGSETREGARLSDLRVMASSEGAPIPRLWGGMRVAGQVIWATDFEEKRQTDTVGGKGGGGGGQKVRSYTYFANFAVALCEGEIDRIGRVWADGKPFSLDDVTARVYTGSESQAPDSLIVAKMGAANAPAYRGTAYIVFERLPLADFGNRLPQLTFEVFRGTDSAASHVRAVSIIPGSTEFGYDTKVVRRRLGPGVTQSENAHASAKRSDFNVSLDELTATCRNAGAAALVVAWFGTDLRCGVCAIRPGVDNAEKDTYPGDWTVNGVSRPDAHPVSFDNGGPAYGGTPSDASVIRAIRELKDRGLKVMLHPFVLMDVPPGNGKPDPYGGPEQAPYPWRGRITASVAPGRPGSPDKTAAMSAEIAAFVGQAQPRHFSAADDTVTYGGPAEWSFRRLILHYAKLCELAGGVDAFLIGSELRGLSTLRAEANQFPFAAAVTSLAGEVKAILPSARVSYGADWTEYSGHQPADGSGDVFFHLDPLWSSPQVDFIGINNYMPLADWRDGNQHADYLAGAKSIHDIAYLKSNIAGGEGFDWYYKSQEDRVAQRRTPIADGAHGKPWVFRPKDLKSWWSNPHYDRPGGVERPTPTGFAPQSKPIWFTEAGCAAIDKGANEPNAFLDPKSSESRPPVFSTGLRDDLMQSRFLAAVDQYWSATGSHNPVSGVYGKTMVDPARIFLWAWDARPYPQFPARADIWSDAANYARGHWLNGRVGALQLGGLIAAVAAAYGSDGADTGDVDGVLHGFMIDRVISGREALRGLMTAFAVDAADSGGGLRFFMRRNAPETGIAADLLAELPGGAPLYAIKRAQETELPAAIKLSYMEAGRDYRLAVVEARHEGGSSKRDGLLELPAAVEQDQAQKCAAIALHDAWAGRETAEFALPPSFLALEPGDALTLELDGGAYSLRIEEVSDGAARKIRGRSFNRAVYQPGGAAPRAPEAETPVLYGAPDALLLDLPLAEAAEPYLPWIAAMADPWPGGLALYRQTGAAATEFNREIDLPAAMGTLMSPLAAAPPGGFDRAASLTVRMAAGELFSVTDEELLQGANLAAVGSMATGWEIIQFGKAELAGAQTYQLSRLLRGQMGSEPEIRTLRNPGERFVLLDQAVVQPQLPLSQAGLEHSWRVLAADSEFGEAEVSITHRPAMLGLRPLSPVHPGAVRSGGDLMLSWIRRTRIGGDSWDLEEVPLGEESERYRLEILSGASLKRSLTLTEPRYLYTASEIAADLAGARQFTLRVAQLSATFGPGPFLERIIDV